MQWLEDCVRGVLRKSDFVSQLQVQVQVLKHLQCKKKTLLLSVYWFLGFSIPIAIVLSPKAGVSSLDAYWILANSQITPLFEPEKYKPFFFLFRNFMLIIQTFQEIYNLFFYMKQTVQKVSFLNGHQTEFRGILWDLTHNFEICSVLLRMLRPLST